MRHVFDPEPVCCFVCKRAAWANGYMPTTRRNRPIAWACEDLDCLKGLRAAYHMSKRELSTYEAESLAEAGEAAGAYLESVGTTDLGSLSREQWLAFLSTVLTGYEDHMREILIGHLAAKPSR